MKKSCDSVGHKVPNKDETVMRKMVTKDFRYHKLQKLEGCGGCKTALAIPSSACSKRINLDEL
jgi:hypothetical protein